MNLKVIILAAGKGSRLEGSTLDLPKPLIDINGISLIQRQINSLKEKNISKIIIIRGYNPDKFQLNNVSYIDDKNFENHDQLGSLIVGINEINEDVLIIFGDILFDEDIIQQILSAEEELVVAVDLDWKNSYEERGDNPIELAGKVLIKDNQILEFSEKLPTEKSGYEIAEFLGIIRIKKSKTDEVRKILDTLQKNHEGKFHDAQSFQFAKLTDFLQEMIDSEIKISPVFIKGQWCEIDTPMDLELARKKFL